MQINQKAVSMEKVRFEKQSVKKAEMQYITHAIASHHRCAGSLQSETCHTEERNLQCSALVALELFSAKHSAGDCFLSIKCECDVNVIRG